jgi:hypothetical protein
LIRLGASQNAHQVENALTKPSRNPAPVLACRYTLQFGVLNGDVECPLVLKRPIGGFDFPRGNTGDQNPVSQSDELDFLAGGRDEAV